MQNSTRQSFLRTLTPITLMKGDARSQATYGNKGKKSGKTFLRERAKGMYSVQKADGAGDRSHGEAGLPLSSKMLWKGEAKCLGGFSYDVTGNKRALVYCHRKMELQFEVFVLRSGARERQQPKLETFESIMSSARFFAVAGNRLSKQTAVSCGSFRSFSPSSTDDFSMFNLDAENDGSITKKQSHPPSFSRIEERLLEASSHVMFRDCDKLPEPPSTPPPLYKKGDGQKIPTTPRTNRGRVVDDPLHRNNRRCPACLRMKSSNRAMMEHATTREACRNLLSDELLNIYLERSGDKDAKAARQDKLKAQLKTEIFETIERQHSNDKNH